MNPGIVVLVVLLFIAVIFIIIACSGNAKSGPSVLVENVVEKGSEPNYDFGIVTTVGNYSYIPLNVYGSGEEHVSKILAVLDAFEKSHTQFEVISWNLQEQPRGYGVYPQLYGIWVHHHNNVW